MHNYESLMTNLENFICTLKTKTWHYIMYIGNLNIITYVSKSSSDQLKNTITITKSSFNKFWSYQKSYQVIVIIIFLNFSHVKSYIQNSSTAFFAIILLN